ncbi:carbohydrate esterase [Caudoviricetes sp.]|nr:carbohydrate esterase [Caudoviricetes sp.]
MGRFRVWLHGGQSNGQGSAPNTTEGGADFLAGSYAPNASVIWAANDNFGEHTSVASLGMIPWGDVVGNAQRMPHHGHEQQIAARAVAEGWTTGGNTLRMGKWTHNGTPVAKFCPGGIAGNPVGTPGVDYYRLRRVLTLACPTATDFEWVYSWAQGESDCDTADGSLAQANALGTNQIALYSHVASIIGKPAKVCLLQQIPIGVWGVNQPSVGPWVAEGRASILAMHNSNAADGCPIRVVNVDDLALYTQDHLHLNSASMHTAGDRFFEAALPFCV